ncbi:uncharacterized protein LOC125944568 [Dermacentor silvarum]|uniref:uncharacterized protein LOC125944568 n=1 Tax=Dermacentor silvarum TaxID=543639 RepID=UPI0021015075|nr:uncharacterized protein LOC125944568 [Dermacentor silvarum]
MHAKAAFLLIVIYGCIETVLCQRPGAHFKKSKQWKNFERDWDILMIHVFTEKDEEILANCCGPGQSKEVEHCVKGSKFTMKEYIELQISVVKWRSSKTRQEEREVKKKIFQMLRRGKISMLVLIKKLRGLLGCLTKIRKKETNNNSQLNWQ